MATVNSGGAAIYYEVHGDGPAVVFAHGRSGNATSWWQQVAWFSRRFQVFVFDHRGFGRSRGVAGVLPRHSSRRISSPSLMRKASIGQPWWGNPWGAGPVWAPPWPIPAGCVRW